MTAHRDRAHCVVGIPATLVFAPLVFGLAEACDPAGLASGVMTGAILGAFAGYKWFDESDIQRS